MKNLDYLFAYCFTLLLSILPLTGFGQQSVDLLLSSDNNCQGQLDIGIFIKASQFSAFDFEIGSSSIFLDYDPDVVQFYTYTENEFSVNIGDPNGWLSHQLSYDDDCGMFSLVLELEDPAINAIYLSRQQAKKIGVVKFVITDPATDPKIAVRPEFSSVFGAGSNDGDSPISILNIPQVVDYSCVDDCDLPPIVRSIEVINEDCFEGSLGQFDISFDDNLQRDSIEISINGGFNYNYLAGDNEPYSVEGISSGYYDVWVRWQNDQCPTRVGNYYVGTDGGPIVDVSSSYDCNASGNGRIQFTFPDQLPVINSLKFSIDGGVSFSPIIADNSGSYTIGNLAVDSYDCYVSWGDGSCLTDLGTIDIIPEDYPTLEVRQFGHCYSTQEVNGALFFDIVDNPVYSQVLLSLDNGATFPYQFNDDIGTFAIYDYNRESFTVRAKWDSAECSSYYGSGFFRYMPRQYDMSIEHSSDACDNELGLINIALYTNHFPPPTISIDGGLNYSFPNENPKQYLFENLSPGDYPIMINWGECIEFHKLVKIQESDNCISCFDGIKNGDETYIDCGGTNCIPCDDCQSLLAVNADEIDENIVFRSVDQIEIKGAINENLTVELSAGQEITLKPQFEVSSNSTFIAYIEDCN